MIIIVFSNYQVIMKRLQNLVLLGIHGGLCAEYQGCIYRHAFGSSQFDNFVSEWDMHVFIVCVIAFYLPSFV